MAIPPTSPTRPFPSAKQNTLGSPPRTNTVVHKVSTPESKHFLHVLANIKTPEKDYLKKKPVHTVIATLNHKSSPLADAKKIRAGLAKTLSVNGEQLYQVKSESTGQTRTYKDHQNGQSNRLIPVSGSNFLRKKGVEVAKAIEDYQKENQNTLNTSDLYEKLKKTRIDSVEPANPSLETKPSTSASSLSFVPRSVLLKKTDPQLESSKKRLASEIESLYPPEWGIGKKEPPEKRLKTEEN